MCGGLLAFHHCPSMVLIALPMMLFPIIECEISAENPIDDIDSIHEVIIDHITSEASRKEFYDSTIGKKI